MAGSKQSDHSLDRSQLIEQFLLSELQARLNGAESNRFASRDFALTQTFKECELHNFLLRFRERTDHVLQKICQIRIRRLEVSKPACISQFRLYLLLKTSTCPP